MTRSIMLVAFFGLVGFGTVACDSSDDTTDDTTEDTDTNEDTDTDS